MDRFSNKEGGFTIAEVLVSAGLMVVLLPFAGNMLANSQLWASYSKHKIQAAYLAQLIMETERQLPFASIVNQAATNYPLDTKGNYISSSNYFYATVVITVTPVVYPNSTIPSTNVDHVVVTITWPENIFSQLHVTMTEIYAEDIANDPMLN
jgi:Tfp pilus assembly protein PilV